MDLDDTPIPEQDLRTMQVLQAALMSGPAMMLLATLAFALTQRVATPEPTPLPLSVATAVVVFATLGALLASSVLYGAQCGPHRFADLARRGDEVPPAEVVAQGLPLLRGGAILRLALLEGAALFGVVILFVAIRNGAVAEEPYVLLNGLGALVMLAVGAATFPTPARLRGLLSRRMEEARRLPR